MARIPQALNLMSFHDGDLAMLQQRWFTSV